MFTVIITLQPLCLKATTTFYQQRHTHTIKFPIKCQDVINESNNNEASIIYTKKTSSKSNETIIITLISKYLEEDNQVVNNAPISLELGNVTNHL